jgi:putative isomerase
MANEFHSPLLETLRNRIDLRKIPFSDRGSRLLFHCTDSTFSLRLAERWFKLDTERMSAYRDRPPLIEHWQFLDGNGSPLKVKLTTYPHEIDCETSAGEFKLAFVDTETLIIVLPKGRCGMSFQANLDQANTDRRGGVLRLTGPIRRSIAYTTNAHLLKNEIQSTGAATQRVLLEIDASRGGEALLLNVTPRLGFNRWIPEPTAALEAAARRWHDWFAAVPEVLEQYRSQYLYAWWIMRAGLISSRFFTTREAMTPSKTHYVGVWQWDNFFHALAFRHIDPHLAQDQLRLLLDHQREDGMIPDAIHDEGTVTHLDFPVRADVTKPPLIAWAAWKLYQHHPDREFLNEIYEPIVRSNNWWFEHNDLDGNGLCEYQHPYSSGLDDSPLWDGGMPVESPDLNTYLCLEHEALAKIAGAIDEPGEAIKWSEGANALAQRIIDRSWDTQSGYFWAKKDGKRVNVRTPFNLFPLITGRLPTDISDRLVAHLTNPHEFWPRFPVPSVALDDPTYNPSRMWRGPTWVNVNYLLIEGLQRSGYPDVARSLRRSTLQMICRQDDIYEYYHPETGERPAEAASAFGWSSAILIDLAIQDARESTSI